MLKKQAMIDIYDKCLRFQNYCSFSFIKKINRLMLSKYGHTRIYNDRKLKLINIFSVMAEQLLHPFKYAVELFVL